MENKNVYVRWISAITLLAVISCFVPVRCGSYCSYSRSYYCSYYGNTQYYDSVKLIGKMAGGIVGGIAGFAILMCSVTIIIVKVCKKTNHGRMVIQPAQPPVSYIDAAQRLTVGQHDPNSTRLHSTPSIQVQPAIRGEEELHHVY
ncbi:uncharacterized protein LOC125653689 [Ostrea edulis]|uniref:uncharacterized protein LOC125653689 n=1 Tax=Ostrea edulis TaxID=37623 RepID=UPI0024AE89C2|nr:uncharacterized protein LOC125653689 [Ostrea edulis]